MKTSGAKCGNQPAEFLALRWSGEALFILDQRRLPQEEIYIEARSPEQVAEAIKTMQVRGAPAIGVAAAFGMALTARAAKDAEMRKRLEQATSLLAATRPTARNLFWALERMSRCAETAGDKADLPELLEREALAIQLEDYQACKAIGDFGAELLPNPATVLTHCNAGALATAGWGTALGVIRSAVGQGKTIAVLADETRPLLQGSRLTAWELKRDGIKVTVIADNAAGYCMRKGMVDAVVVGADRIARNGDVVNKIGTFQVATLAQRHNIPFYVAAPLSTVDTSLACGEEIIIEEREAGEVSQLEGRQIAAPEVEVFNPAFDVTPAELVTAIICEKGVLRPPFAKALCAFAK
jgi:methylthioribose-1-phosphate isomerase